LLATRGLVLAVVVVVALLASNAHAENLPTTPQSGAPAVPPGVPGPASPASHHNTVPSVGQAWAVVGQAAAGVIPDSLAYDSGKGEVFLFDSESGNVTVLSDSNLGVVATIPVAAPSAQGGSIAYDAGKGELFVSVARWDNVSVISDQTNTVVKVIPVGVSPGGLSYDPSQNEVFVPNYDSANVSVIADSNNTVVASIPVGGYPKQSAYDPGTHSIYVTNYFNNVSVISDLTDTVTATVVIGPAGFSDLSEGLVDVPSAEELFVALATSQMVVINDSNSSVATHVSVGQSPFNPAYDAAEQEVLVPDYTANTTSIISVANETVVQTLPVGGFPYAACYDSGTGEVFVADRAGGVSVLALGDFYDVTFGESGLPGAVNWTVTLSGAYDGLNQSLTTSVPGSVTFHVPNGTYPYSISEVPGWVESTLPSAGRISVSGANVTEPIAAYSQVTYEARFSEAGLPSGETYQVTVNGSAQTLRTDGGVDTITFGGLPNGTYSYEITGIPGWNQTTLPYSGSFSVTGGTQPVGGTGVGYAVTVDFSEVTYALRFVETGLPSGTTWGVIVNGTTLTNVTSGPSGLIVFQEPNGTLAVSLSGTGGYAVSPSGGFITIAGQNVTVVLTFSLLPSSAPGGSSGGIWEEGQPWVWVLLAGIGGAALGVGVTILIRGRAGRPPRPD
jgi:YVTN family beta-propeller protein